MKISVIIITLNEERNIGRCLESVKDVADEIIVADSFSEDKTEEICSQYNVTFVKQKWLGFAEQKNFANNLAHNDWILSIDADEALSEELKKSVLELKKRDFDEHNVFSLNRLTNYCGKWIHHSGWYPDRRIRLWNRKIGQWNGIIHETICFDQPVVKINIKGDLLHYSYEDIKDHIRIANKYTSMIAREKFEKGGRYSFVKMYLSPPFAFIRDFIFKGGFLDGKRGFAICKINSFSTYLKYLKLWELENEKKRNNDNAYSNNV